MSGCIKTSVVSWKPWVNAISTPWIYGGESLITSGRTRRLRCAAQGKATSASERKYEGTPEDLDYPQMCTRRVCQHGLIRVEGQRLFLSTSLAGWSVGLKPIATDLLEVWFGQLLLRAGGFGDEQFYSGGYPPE